MHKAWFQLGTRNDPESKPGSCGSTFRNFPAFVQPLCTFFKIADGVRSKFYDADAFDTAKRLYYEALEAHVDLKRKLLALSVAAGVAIAAGGAVVGDGSVAANGSAPADGSVNVDDAEPTDDLVAADPLTTIESLQMLEESAKLLVLQRLGALVHLLGTLQYLPDSCAMELIQWGKVTKGDDQLLPLREVKMTLTKATPEVRAII